MALVTALLHSTFKVQRFCAVIVLEVFGIFSQRLHQEVVI